MILPNLAAAALFCSSAMAQIDPEILEANPHLKDLVMPKITTPRMPRWKDVEHPLFEPYPVEDGELADGAIFDQFNEGSTEIFKKWKVSKALNKDGKPFTGNWTIEEPEILPGFDKDYALLLSANQESSAIARKIDPPLNNINKTLIVQYEVKLQKPLNCGGMYVKLLPETSDPDYSSFNDASPYRIMFGPDMCGSLTNKVHFIIHRYGSEHQLVDAPIPADPSFKSGLYTLMIHPDQEFEIRVNGITVKAGSLLDPELFEPPLQGPVSIFDPEDPIPEDWDSRKFIPDPEQTEQPEDWYDTTSYLIVNTKARKPNNWNESKPLLIPDLDQPKPQTWDDEIDGEWPGMVKINPECEFLNTDAGEGCGPWQPPLIRNPNYKRQWEQPVIINPNYMGEYKRRTIVNDNRTEDTDASNLDGTIGGIGFELFTSSALIMFDNVYVGHSITDAENIGNATWNPKFYIETLLSENVQRAFHEQQEVYTNENNTFVDIYKYEISQLWLDPKGYSLEIYEHFMREFAHSRWEAVRQFPVSVFVFIMLLFISTTTGIFLFDTLMRPLSNKLTERKSGEKASCKELDQKGVDEHKKHIQQKRVEGTSSATTDSSTVTQRKKKRS
ncbi:calnexin [Starmerella bacillaris]|uniref:Calnexin n=1 Tax=Starmerella bacillaris TaxID=1247836 RepID=A0AAV5RNH0_STABA|nr:calnexin [Starmerella bacillaris]